MGTNTFICEICHCRITNLTFDQHLKDCSGQLNSLQLSTPKQLCIKNRIKLSERKRGFDEGIPENVKSRKPVVLLKRLKFDEDCGTSMKTTQVNNEPVLLLNRQKEVETTDDSRKNAKLTTKEPVVLLERLKEVETDPVDDGITNVNLNSEGPVLLLNLDDEHGTQMKSAQTSKEPFVLLKRLKLDQECQTEMKSTNANEKPVVMLKRLNLHPKYETQMKSKQTSKEKVGLQSVSTSSEGNVSLYKKKSPVVVLKRLAEDRIDSFEEKASSKQIRKEPVVLLKKLKLQHICTICNLKKDTECECLDESDTSDTSLINWNIRESDTEDDLSLSEDNNRKVINNSPLSKKAKLKKCRVTLPEWTNDKKYNSLLPKWARITWQNETREKLLEQGFYNRFPDDDPHIQGLREYMVTGLGVTSNNHINIVAADIARFFYFIQDDDNKEYIDPKALVNKPHKVQEWIRSLKSLSAKGSTIEGMAKSLSRFIKYIIACTHVFLKDRDFYEALLHFRDSTLADWKTSTKKQAMLEKYDKDFKCMIGETPFPTTKEIRKNLINPSILDRVDRILAYNIKTGKRRKKDGDHNNYVFVTRYLISTLVLKSCKRPGAIKNLNVGCWKKTREVDGYYVIAIQKHKTERAPCLVTISAEDHKRLQLYWDNLRQDQPIDKVDPFNAPFFICYVSGHGYTSMCEELRLWQRDLSLPVFQGGSARKAAENDMHMTNSCDRDNSLVTKYLNHGEAVARRYYRLDSYDNAVKAQNLIEKLAAAAEEDDDESSPSDRTMIVNESISSVDLEEDGNITRDVGVQVTCQVVLH